MHGKAELGKIAAEKLFELDPQDSGNHVLLSNMLASSGRWAEATNVRKEMKDAGIKKDPGCSWITWKNGVHVFHAKDTKHEMNSEIRALLAKLRKQMQASGYMPDTQYSLYDVDEEEKESEVFQHSEKLALAFGLIHIPPGVPIRITKNLRIFSRHPYARSLAGRQPRLTQLMHYACRWTGSRRRLTHVRIQAQPMRCGRRHVILNVPLPTG